MHIPKLTAFVLDGWALGSPASAALPRLTAEGFTQKEPLRAGEARWELGSRRLGLADTVREIFGYQMELEGRPFPASRGVEAVRLELQLNNFSLSHQIGGVSARTVALDFDGREHEVIVWFKFEGDDITFVSLADVGEPRDEFDDEDD